MKWFAQHSKSNSLAWLMTAFLALLVAGCGGGGGGSESAAPAQGTLGVALTDAAACGFDAVNVTVLKVRAHQSSAASENDAGWTDITLNPARKINLLNLTNGVLENLGETPLAVGHYTQLRLVLDPNTVVGLSNSVVPTGGVEVALVTPSAVQSGIKLINEFDVAANQRVDLVLDFDACKSIVTRGNGTYALKPVIKVIPTVLNGINGFIDMTLIGTGIMVTAQQGGVIKQSTSPNTLTGEFFLARLAPGSYDVVLTANGRATAVIAAVPVATTTSVTAVSNVLSGVIALAVSATRTVSGSEILNPVSTESAYVAAKQTFIAPAPATTVTVKYVAASDLTGAYALTLPIGEPKIGAYGTGTLPIAFTPQSGMAGKYTVEAYANTYLTQSVSKDISSSDATADFTLVH